jgi:RNA polymerase sigma-70 factor (ECF subfamily)
MGRAWLFGVAHRVVGNQYRGRKRRARLPGRLAVGDPPVRSDGVPIRDDELDRLMEALGSLSETDQELLRLSSWDRLSRAEIAYVLGIKENAVDQRLHRARARLRTRLDQIKTHSTSVAPKEAST